MKDISPTSIPYMQKSRSIRMKTQTTTKQTDVYTDNRTNTNCKFHHELQFINMCDTDKQATDKQTPKMHTNTIATQPTPPIVQSKSGNHSNLTSTVKASLSPEEKSSLKILDFSNCVGAVRPLLPDIVMNTSPS